MLALLFAAATCILWRKSKCWDLALWAVVWAARTAGSLLGARQAEESQGDLKLYIEIQTVAAVLLLLAMVRAELRVCKEKFVSHFKERIHS